MTLVEGARTAINTCMNVKKGEKVLIITDTKKERIGEALFNAAEEANSEAMIIKMLPRTRNAEEPPKPIAEIMKTANVIVAPTQYSISHTQARKKANQQGTRIATMPGITEKMMSSGGMTADFDDVKKTMKRVVKSLKGDEAKITTKLGTNLTLSVKGRKWISDTGICHKKGEFINLPGGEIFIAPLEGTANGKLVIDGAILGKVEEPIKITIKDGFAEKFKGGEQAKNLKKIYEEASKKLKDPYKVYNIAELGIGMNPKAKIIGNVLEDEKVLGTVHVAIGDNSTFGGLTKCGIHMDGIIKNPTLTVGKNTILENGKLIA